MGTPEGPTGQETSRWTDAANVVLKLGAGTAIGVYLVYQLANTLPAMARTLDQHVAEVRSGNSRTNALLYAMCLGINKANDEARALCEVGREVGR